MEQDGQQHDLVLWVIAGGAIILGLVYAIANAGKGGSQTVLVSSSGQSADAIAQANEAYNQGAFNVKLGLANTAAQLETARIGYAASIKTNADNNTAHYQLAQLEEQYAAQMNRDTLSAQTSQLQIQTAGAQSLAQIEAQRDVQINQQNVNLEHAISDNETTQVRINKGSSFGNFMQALAGNASSILTSLGGLGLKI